ncbi:hypothetical protein JCM3765_003634 [Sporobolomyces pararoseus]
MNDNSSSRPSSRSSSHNSIRISQINNVRTRTPSLERVATTTSNGPKIIRQQSSSFDNDTNNQQEQVDRNPPSPLHPPPPPRPTSSFSILSSSTTTGGGGGGGRINNGPIVTRVQSIMGQAPPPLSTTRLRVDSEQEEDEEDLNRERARGRVERGRGIVSSSGNYRSHQRDQTSESSTIWNGGFTPKASQDPLLIKPLPPPVPSNLTADQVMHDNHEEPSITPIYKISKPFTEIPSVPILSNSKRIPLKRYQLHSGSNRFFLKGFFITSKDNPLPFLGSLIVAIGLPIIWLIFVGRGIWINNVFGDGGGGGKGVVIVFSYLCLISWSSMFKTSLGDPGILPRNLDPNPQKKFVLVEQDGEGKGEKGQFVAEMKYLRVRDGVVGSKWCETCEIYRPPRTSHCRLCDNCVELTDHHCAFLNNCIGRRNYFPFLSFLLSSTLLLIYSIIFTSYYISKRSTTFASRWDSIGSYIILVMLVIVLIPLGGLFIYHLRLVLNNQTTIEMLRPKSSRGGLNPQTGENLENLWKFSSRFKNCLSVWCRPGIGEYGGRGGWRDVAKRDKRLGGDGGGGVRETMESQGGKEEV